MGYIEESRKPDKTPLHTSGYAEAANGESMGATSTESFEQRQALSNRRAIVGSYGESFLGRGHAGRCKRTVQKQRFHSAQRRPEGNLSQQADARQQHNAQLNVPARPTTGFREPPSRGFNPYA